MYNTYFGFREKPFKLVPNPDFLYLSKNHEIALAHLSYAVSQGDGFVVITGEVGTGKTTLCRIFLERLEEGIESAYIFNPRLDSVQLLTTICNEFGIRTNSNNLKQLLDVINGYLIMKNKAGRKVILLIDEAQNLSIENLEMVRMLSNLETTRNKLLQIILVGQPELGEMLDSYELRQLAQRISLSAHLTPLTNAETAGYIEHRTLIAAQRQLDLFTPRACRLIHKFSSGIPRKINIAADRALLTAYSLNRAKVTAGVAKIAIEELMSSRTPTPAGNSAMTRRTMLWAAVICSLFLMVAGVYAKRDVLLKGALQFNSAADSGQSTSSDQVVRTYKIHNNPPAIAPAVSANPASGIAQPGENFPEAPGPSIDLAEAIDTLEHESSRLDAMKFVLQKWQQAPPSAYQLPPMAIDPEYFEIAAHQYGLRMYTVESDWALVKQLNLPAIITIKKHRSAELVYMAMVGWSGGQIQLALSGRRGLVQTDLESLLPHTQGTVYVYWKNTLGFDPVINANAPPQAIQAVKKMLRQIGYEKLSLEVAYDRATEKAILDFQLRHSLTPDGLVGSLTKIFLINEAEESDSGVDRPRLYGDSEGREGV
ncbi:MAG: AAA family ATPase [Desulfobacterales bacterium]|nr:AAA family ATPase [Desulfobacterales bacterium]